MSALILLRKINLFKVTSLKKTEEIFGTNIDDKCEDIKETPKTGTLALFRRPYLKWMSLLSFLMFGVFAS